MESNHQMMLMDDTSIDNNKNNIRMLRIGLVILALCLCVCIYMVYSINKSYRNEVSSDFHKHHECVGAMVNNRFNKAINQLNEIMDTIQSQPSFPNYDKLFEILNIEEDSDLCMEAAFLTDKHCLFYDNKSTYIDVTESKYGWEDQVVSFTTKTNDGKCFGYKRKEESGEKYYILIEKPLFYEDNFKGYLLLSVDVTKLLAEDIFKYQNQIGECYIINADGYVVTKSLNTTIFDGKSSDFFDMLLAYSDGEEKSKTAVQLLRNDIRAYKTNYETLVTSKGYSLQVSICPIKCINKMFFVSCYNDNLVDDKVQPLIFGSVLSCIIIVVLMICIILFVWVSAKKTNITIERLAYVDPVTGGKNINYFKNFAIKTMNVFKETPFVIYRFDIVNFRYINEAYGHVRADGILKACINSFEKVFSDKELCVRLNADQFLAILVNDKSLDLKFKEFLNMVNEDARGLGIKYYIKFKLGICQIRKHERDIDVLIDHANVARKALTADGKEMSAMYSENTVNEMRKIDRIESDQQRALATEEFKVFLQPKWNINEDRIAGAEALVRWIKADGTMIYPDSFIPIFEKNGFVEKLDFYMLEKVCSYMNELIQKGKKVYPISVNQSRLLLHSTDYVKNVDKILKQYGIPTGYIELEITETVFENERDEMIRIAKELKTIGVKLSMDDFGSGYSSLNMLKDVPFDVIKIDREFFSESVTSENSLWILRKIIEMANGIGMEIVCEGVENAEQVSLLQSIGCIVVQGYYYSKPVAYEEFVEKYCL